MLHQFFKSRRAASLTGYTLTVGLVAVIAITATSNIGGNISTLFKNTSNSMEQAAEGTQSNNGSSGGETGGSGSSQPSNPDLDGSFNDLASAGPSVTVTSNIIEYIGAATASASISSDDTLGNPQFRICANATCSGNPVFVAGPANIAPNQWIQLQIVAPNTSGNTRIATLDLDAVTSDWSVTALTPAGVPAGAAINMPSSGGGYTTYQLTTSPNQCPSTSGWYTGITYTNVNDTASDWWAGQAPALTETVLNDCVISGSPWGSSASSNNQALIAELGSNQSIGTVLLGGDTIHTPWNWGSASNYLFSAQATVDVRNGGNWQTVMQFSGGSVGARWFMITLDPPVTGDAVRVHNGGTGWVSTRNFRIGP